MRNAVTSRGKILGGAQVLALLLPGGLVGAQGLPPASSKHGSNSSGGATARSAPAKGAKGANEARPLIPVDYTIGEEDVLEIIVWKERELSGTVVVRPDGRITMPLVNDITALGLTPVELQAMITERLRPFLAVPQVTVSVRQINSRKVYVLGQVGREGAVRINSTTTVLQALAEAGGLKDFAKRKDIVVLRNESGKQVRYVFNYDQVLRGKNTSQNIVLRPGDTIVVP